MGTKVPAKKRFRLTECLDQIVDNRGKTPPLSETGIELLEVNAIIDGRKAPAFENVRKFVLEETYANWFRSGHPRQGDTLISTVGAIGRVAYVRDERGCIAQNIVSLRPKPDVLDGEFLYYLLSSSEVQHRLLSLNIGVAQPSLKVPHLLSLEIELPPVPVQQRIAGILSAYDELIENSQKRIKILESMARALYREWFVHFRFPGHESVPLVPSVLGDIPQGWEVKNLKDVASVTYGFPFASKKFNINGVGTPVIRIRDILNGTINTCTDEYADPKYFIKNEDILVGMDGDFHMCIWSSGHAFQNQRVAKFASNGEIGNYHLFLALEVPIQTWNKAIVGTTVAHLGDIHIKTIQFVLPPIEILTEASEILEPMSLQIIALKRQIQNLRDTRDLLLPRLLSGQIDMGAVA